MNDAERRIRIAINRCSTAFAKWWCDSGRYLRVVRMITGGTAAPTSRPARLSSLPAVSAAEMAARKAAIDALLAARAPEDPGH